MAYYGHHESLEGEVVVEEIVRLTTEEWEYNSSFFVNLTFTLLGLF